VSNSNVDRHSHKYDRRLNTNGADFRDVDDQASCPAFMSVDAEVHLEPGPQSDRLIGHVNSKQNGGCHDQVPPDHVVSEDGVGLRMNFAQKRHSVEPNNLPLPGTSHNADDYLVPATEPARFSYNVSRKESVRYEDNSPSNEDYREDIVYTSVEDIGASRVTGEVQATPSLADKQPVVILQSEAVSKGQTDLDTVAEAAAGYDSVHEGRISDAPRRKSTDGSLYHVQPELTGSISLGEIVTDTQGTDAWTDLDTAAESAAVMPIHNTVHEGTDSDGQRRKSTDRSLYPVQSSFAPSVSNGEVVVDAEDNLDLLQAEGLESHMCNAPNSVPSKSAEQLASIPGS